jgi:hypothetical protein
MKITIVGTGLLTGMFAHYGTDIYSVDFSPMGIFTVTLGVLFCIIGLGLSHD